MRVGTSIMALALVFWGCAERRAAKPPVEAALSPPAATSSITEWVESDRRAQKEIAEALAMANVVTNARVVIGRGKTRVTAAISLSYCGSIHIDNGIASTMRGIDLQEVLPDQTIKDFVAHGVAGLAPDDVVISKTEEQEPEQCYFGRREES